MDRRTFLKYAGSSLPVATLSGISGCINPFQDEDPSRVEAPVENDYNLEIDVSGVESADYVVEIENKGDEEIRDAHAYLWEMENSEVNRLYLGEINLDPGREIIKNGNGAYNTYGPDNYAVAVLDGEL